MFLSPGGMDLKIVQTISGFFPTLFQSSTGVWEAELFPEKRPAGNSYDPSLSTENTLT